VCGKEGDEEASASASAARSAPRNSRACALARCSLYWLYQYKSTNSDASGAGRLVDTLGRSPLHVWSYEKERRSVGGRERESGRESRRSLAAGSDTGQVFSLLALLVQKYKY
jgi:hypothetical protein